jgi:hypothetical protein
MKKWMLRIFALAVLPGNGLNAQAPASQAPDVLDRQAAVGSRMKFDVASVKENKIDLPERPYSSFPMGLGDMYSSNGGHLIARNWPFAVYLQFAYKMTDGQLEATMGPMPDWTKTARFDIESESGRRSHQRPDATDDAVTACGAIHTIDSSRNPTSSRVRTRSVKARKDWAKTGATSYG